MLGDLLQINIYAFLLVFARVGAVIVFLPGFNATYVNIKSRLTMALGLALIITPFLMSGLPILPAAPVALLLLILGEIVIGSVIGITTRVLLGALQTAGTLISLFASMANAMIRDPIAEQQSSLLASFLGTLAVIVIFAADMHHLMIRSIVESYSLFIPGEPLPYGDFSELMARRVADSFILGVQLAAPFIVSAMVYYIGLGILGRLMQTLPVFFVVMPLQIAGQIALLMASLSTIMMYFLSRFEEGVIVFLEP